MITATLIEVRLDPVVWGMAAINNFFLCYSSLYFNTSTCVKTTFLQCPTEALVESTQKEVVMEKT